MTEAECQALRQKVDHWVAGPGKKKLEQLKAQMTMSRKEVSDALRPDPSTLDKPMTI